MTALDDMKKSLKPMPFEQRERHRQGLKHRDYVLGYHESVRQFLQKEITNTIPDFTSTNNITQVSSAVYLLDLKQSIKSNDDSEMICLNMIDFNDNVNTSVTVESKPPDITSDWYKKGFEAANTILSYSSQALQLMSHF